MADQLPSIRGGAARRRGLFDALDEGVVVQDAGGAVRDWNAAALRLLSVEPEQIEGRAPLHADWHVSIDGPALRPHAEGLRTLLGRALDKGSVTVAVHPPEGTTRWIAISSHVVRDDDDASGETIVSTMTDVTAQ